MDLLQNDKAFQNLFNKYLISRVASYQHLLIQRIQDKPEVRYKKFFRKIMRYYCVYSNIISLPI
ncbi:MAG: hypothetical protein BGO54_07065 [Sphingobacteriales bacterium 46-32]|nr:MAG: hypothetical protein BGO54_07065 [Sphingobacteriales bacterium 46-32]